MFYSGWEIRCFSIFNQCFLLLGFYFDIFFPSCTSVSAELLFLPPPAGGDLALLSVLQTIKTRRSPHRAARQHLRSQPGIGAMNKA